MTDSQKFWDLYVLAAFFFGVISGLIIWGIAFFQWGFLLGLMFGWIPALIGGLIIGTLWLPFLIICFIYWLYITNSNSEYSQKIKKNISKYTNEERSEEKDSEGNILRTFTGSDGNVYTYKIMATGTKNAI